MSGDFIEFRHFFGHYALRILAEGGPLLSNRLLDKRDLIIILHQRQHAGVLADRFSGINQGMLFSKSATINCACPSEHLAAKVLVARGLQILHVVPLASNRPFELLILVLGIL